MDEFSAEDDWMIDETQEEWLLQIVEDWLSEEELMDLDYKDMSEEYRKEPL